MTIKIPGFLDVSPCNMSPGWSAFLFFFKFYLFIFGCAGSLLLLWLFSSRGERSFSLVLVRGPIIVVASPVVEHGL